MIPFFDVLHAADPFLVADMAQDRLKRAPKSHDSPTQFIKKSMVSGSTAQWLTRPSESFLLTVLVRIEERN